MPENRSENAIIPDGTIPAGEALPETAKEKFERERLSRRQALKRLGMTSAMATFAMFSVDDLARMVGKAMQQRAGDNKIAMQVAKEFQSAGIALADGQSGPDPQCANCEPHYEASLKQAAADFAACYSPYIGTFYAPYYEAYCNGGVYCPEVNNAYYAYYGCCTAHCASGTCAGRLTAPGC